MNVQGLGDKNKRLDVIDFLKQQKGSIYFLQDTHFTDDLIKQIYLEVNLQCYFNNFSSQSRGVAIFISNTLDFQLKSINRDTDGNMLILDCSICNKNISLINIYGPNQDKPEFYKLLNNKIQHLDSHCIIAGDFNLVLNPDMDAFDYVNLNNPKAREVLLELIMENNLVDSWREFNLEKKEFTWFKKNSQKKSRLDYFFYIKQSIS